MGIVVAAKVSPCAAAFVKAVLGIQVDIAVALVLRAVQPLSILDVVNVRNCVAALYSTPFIFLVEYLRLYRSNE